MRFFIAVSMFLSSIAFADTLTVKMDCKDGKCVPAGTDASGLAKQVASLRNQLNVARRALEKAGVSQITGDDLIALKDKVRKLENEVKEMSGVLNNTAGVALSVADSHKKLAKEVELLKEQVDGLTKGVVNKFKDVDERVDNLGVYMKNSFNRRKINLDLGAFGLFSSPFGLSAGGMLTLDFPLGEGYWRTRMSAGLGVSPSKNLSVLTSLSVVRNLTSYFSFGPAVLAVLDMKDVVSDAPMWFAGGGMEMRFMVWKINMLVMPFVGGGPAYETGTTTKYDYSDTPCGKVVSESTTAGSTRKVMNIQGGVVVGFTFSLF